MSHPQLFDDPTAKETAPGPRLGHLATPAPVGSGPDGETCKTCRFAERIRWHDKTYHKCKLMEKYWTHGGGTDIKLRWAACKSWVPPESRVLGLGKFAEECIEKLGWSRESLLIIADYYDETGQDMAWLRLAAVHFPSMPNETGG